MSDLFNLLTNQEQLVAAVQSAGLLGPALFVLLQVLQTVCAPIPGSVVGIAGGYIFGWWGILWTILGCVIGYYIVFKLSKRFGRPLVEKLFKKETLDKFDFITGKHASYILFMIFLIPALPDDMVCYIGGLTKLPIRKLMFLVIVGRLPSIVVTNYLGAGLGEGQLLPVAVVTIIMIFIMVLAVYFREPILAYLRSKSSHHKNQNEENQ